MTKMKKHLANAGAQAGKQLGSSLDQLELDKRLSEVERSLASLADKVGLAERKSVLGVPVSRKRPAWGKIAAIGAATVGALAAGARALGSDSAEGELDGKHTAIDHKQDESGT